MTPLLTVEQLESRCPPHTLPLSQDGETLDTARILIALRDATGVIVSHLPWLLDENGEITDPVPAQFEAALYSICADIACLRLTDTVGSSEDERAKYSESIKLLDKIDKNHQGSLSGPGYQDSCVVVPNDADGISDMRFFKKGRMF